MRAEADGILRDLFSHFFEHPELMPAEWGRGSKRRMKPVALGAIADYIAGMTDRYAAAEHARLKGTRNNAGWDGMSEEKPSRSRFQIFAEFPERAKGPGRLSSLRHVLREAKLDGFLGAEGRRASKRICAGIGGALRLAHRLHGIGGATRRRSEVAAVFVDGATPCRCMPRWMRRPSARSRPLTSRSTSGSPSMPPRTRRSASIRSFTHQMPSSVSARRSRAPELGSWPAAANPIDAIWTDRPEPERGRAAPRC